MRRFSLWFVGLVTGALSCAGASGITPAGPNPSASASASVAGLPPTQQARSYSADCYRLVVSESGAAELSCGNDRWQWPRHVPTLAHFIYSQSSVQFALVTEAVGDRFDVDIVSINGSYQDHATLEGSAVSAAFVRRGAVLEIEEASGTRAWVYLTWSTASRPAHAPIELLSNAQGIPSRRSLEAAASARWAPIGAKHQELYQVEITPPFPSDPGTVTFYGYAEEQQGGGGGPSSGVPLTRDSSIWSAFTASASHRDLVATHESFGDVTSGPRATGYVPDQPVAAFERERDHLEASFIADVYAGRGSSDAVRAHYCFWSSLHPTLAKTLRARHPAFFSALACK